MFEKLSRNIFIVIGIAILFYFVLLIYTDIGKVLDSFSNFPSSIFIKVILLISVSLYLKFIRWNSYLKSLKISLKKVDSILIFLSGLIMSVTPGRIGEIFKAYLVKKKYHISKSKTFSVVIAERGVEFIALIIISIITSVIYEFKYSFILVTTSIIILILVCVAVVLRSKIFSTFMRVSYLQNRIDDLILFKNSLIEIFRPILFIKMLILSIVAWFIEFLGFYLIMNHFSDLSNILISSFTYSISIVIGAVSMIPGGIGATEGSLSYLLILNGFSGDMAVSSTLIIRIATLWFSVIIGFIAYFIFLNINNEKK